MSFDLEGVDYYETRKGLTATSREALSQLRETVSEVSKNHQFRNRKHHKILLDNIGALCLLIMVISRLYVVLHHGTNLCIYVIVMD